MTFVIFGSDNTEFVIDKAFVLILSALLSLYTYSEVDVILPLLLALIVCCADELVPKKAVTAALYGIYCGVAIFYPPMLCYAPAAAYGLIIKGNIAYSCAFIVVPLLTNLEKMPFTALGCVAVMALVTVSSRVKMKVIMELYEKNRSQRDSLTQLTLELENKLNTTLSEQNFEIKNAQLGERNRIAREIHDNVGHQLSCSIIQLGAIIAIEKDEKTKALLTQLSDTLNTGMNSIRSSVHDLRDESLDLYTTLYTLCAGFTFCKCTLKYEISKNPENKYVYAFTGIVKEALSNVIKHSDATEVNVILSEHPKLYQLIVSDNGTISRNSSGHGMGLENIRQRVSSLDGIVNITNDDGYRIFVSAKK